jgi:hypothetical protein
MISSKTLKNFVKMHEYKLNAKVNALRAEKMDSELDVHWGADCMEEHHKHISRNADRSVQHQLYKSDVTNARPKSRYFDFILTSAH